MIPGVRCPDRLADGGLRAKPYVTSRIRLQVEREMEDARTKRRAHLGHYADT